MSVGSSVSFESSTRTRTSFVKQWRHYRFTSNWEYIVVTTACTITVTNFSGLTIVQANRNEPTIIHHLICYLLIGLPLNYMQTLLGQYSQLGVIFFKHICPAGHGLGYTAILNSLVWCTRFGVVLADFLMYLLCCMDGTLNWMTCPPNTEDRCWDTFSKCERNCISKGVETSAQVFWAETFMQNVDFDPKYLRLGAPIWTRVAPLCLSWVLVYFMVSLGIDRYTKIVRVNSYLIYISVIILILVSFITHGAMSGIALMFHTNINSFTNTALWSYSMIRVIQVLALSRAFHMTYGSYMTPQMPSDVLTIFCVLINFLATFLMSLVTYATLGIIMSEAHVDESQIQQIWKEERLPYLTVLPQGIGFMGVPQLWTVLYFLVCIAILINNLTIQMDAVQRSIADAHSRIGLYQNYILVTLCALCCSMGFVFSSKEGFVISQRLYRKVLQKVRVFDIFVMCVLTFWIYRVQRLSDDIHFMQGSQPTKFWKICWYLMPCAVGFVYVYVTFIVGTKRVSSVFEVMHYLSYSILVSPILLCLIYEIFRHLKVHNLVGILQPEERWGPPDPEERHLRRKFNPRQEIRSRRRDDTCHHNCLLNSKNLRRAISDEREQREIYRRILVAHQEGAGSIAGRSRSTETTQSQ